jgi:dipeptidyl aminopeptidase/acylaminoacyl peptidase
MRRLALAISLCLCAAAPAPAAEGLTPWQLARMRSVSSAAISPDGARIAYTLSVPRRPPEEEDGPPWSQLHVVSRDGRSRPYVAGAVTVSDVQWTPDGREISFVARRGSDEFAGVYVIAADGGESRKVISHGADIGACSWSPDGRRVAFLATEEKPKKRRDLEKKGFDQQVLEESAPFVRLWVASREATAPARQVAVDGSVSQVKWSPSGASLAITVAPSPAIDDDYMKRKVEIVDAESGKVLARVDTPGKLGPIAWSPNGRSLALISAADPNDPAASRLLVVPAEGGTPRDLLPGGEAGVTAFAWESADDLLYVADQGVETTIGRVRRDGSGRRTLVPAGGPVLSSLQVAPRARVAATLGQTAQFPSEVFVFPSDAAAPRRLTDSNPWLSGVALGRQEVVRFRARDGLELEGLLIRPVASPAGPAPLILTVHGGPEGHYRNGWLTGYADPGQVAAAKGLAVFYPNYRGSTGRGVAFSKLGQKDPAGREFDDLVDAVDHLVGAGVADRAKVGITGGSYGGYATAWCSSRYSERFAAGVMFVGISDLVSKAGTTDIPNEEYMVHARQWPWENWQFMMERSPIFYADRVRTPLLILDGKEDPRVHPGQSLAFYRYVKERGKAPVRLVLYPKEGHGNRTAAHRLDYNLRMIRWMEHYLKGPAGPPPAWELDYDEPRSGTRDSGLGR